MGATSRRKSGKLEEQRGSRAHASRSKAGCWPKRASSTRDFRTSLGRYRVLDPACGSGNFLALGLRALKDFDLAVLEDAAAIGLPRDDFRVGPDAVMGIEVNRYAAELARLTVWITELQWQLREGLGIDASADPRQTRRDRAGGRINHAER